MSRLIIFLTVMWLSTAAAHVDLITNITKSVTNGITKEIATIAHPIKKSIMYIGFKQCKHVKRLIGVDYDSYNTHELDLSELTLNFVTRNVNVIYKLTAAAELIPGSGWFNPRYPLKIYLHGFTEDPSRGSYTELSKAFLNQGDFNIVALDASSLIRWCYLRSTTMVRFIGEELGKMLAALVYAGLYPSDIHLIGHSLGSHISGFAGKTFFNLTGYRVGRISGLDPAGPCFSNVNTMLRLNIHDADFVDVIHTDAGVYGLNEQVGHVDFYPNSGSKQPNCLSTVLPSCSHSMAWLLFAESVASPQAFVATSCANWQAFRNGDCDYSDRSLMGYGCQAGTTGSYYLQTAEKSPYGRGTDGMLYLNNEGLLKNMVISMGDVLHG